jgi:hypothetical protein
MRKLNSFLVLAVILVSFTAVGASQSIISADRIEYVSEGSDFYDGPVLQAAVSSNYQGDNIIFNTGNRNLADIVSGQTNNTLEVEVESQDIFSEYAFTDPSQTARPDLAEFGLTTIIVNDIDPQNEKQELENSQKVRNICTDINQDGDLTGGNKYAKYTEGASSDYDFYYSQGSSDWSWEDFEFESADYDVTCITQIQYYGNVGEISNPVQTYTTTWEARNGQGKVERTTLSNSEMAEGNVGRLGPNVRVEFNGGETTGLTSPRATDELILHSNDGLESTDGFRVLNSGSYESYQIQYDSLESIMDEYFEIKADQGYVNDDTTESLFSEVNREASQAYRGISSGEFTEMEFSSNGDGLAEGTGRIYEENLFYPQFTVEAKACRNLDLSECDAFINIKKEVGIPKITDISTKKFSELSQAEVNLSYKNIGYSEGSFEARITECTNSFEPTGVPKRQSLDEGESVTEQLYLTGSTTDMTEGEKTGYCVAEVTETGTLQTVQQRFQVTLVQESECTYYDSLGYGQQTPKKESATVDGEEQLVDVIYECKENELGYNLKETCDADEVAKKDKSASGVKYDCVAEEEENTGGGSGSGDGSGEGSDCKVTIVDNPAGNDLTVTNPVCAVQNWIDSVFGGVYGNLTLFTSILLGLYGFGFRGRLARIMSLEPTNVLSVFGRSISARYVLGLALFGAGFWIGLNIMTNPVIKWGLIIVTVIAAVGRIWLYGPAGLIDWIFPETRR